MIQTNCAVAVPRGAGYVCFLTGRQMWVSLTPLLFQVVSLGKKLDRKRPSSQLKGECCS